MDSSDTSRALAILRQHTGMDFLGELSKEVQSLRNTFMIGISYAFVNHSGTLRGDAQMYFSTVESFSDVQHALTDSLKIYNISNIRLYNLKLHVNNNTSYTFYYDTSNDNELKIIKCEGTGFYENYEFENSVKNDVSAIIAAVKGNMKKKNIDDDDFIHYPMYTYFTNNVNTLDSICKIMNNIHKTKTLPKLLAPQASGGAKSKRLTERTVKELQALCRERKIPFSNLRKDELVKKLQKKRK
jgi:hypothetical protein